MSCTYNDENDYVDDYFDEDDVVWPFWDSTMTWPGKLSIIGETNCDDDEDNGDDADRDLGN